MKVTLLRFFSANVRLAMLGLLLMLGSNAVYAEGSKDLYPENAIGYRAVLRSSTTVDGERWPFPTRGTHYVYAIAGEIITLASSAQSATTNSAIQLYGPGGVMLINDATAAGQIPNRVGELAGPKLHANDTAANRYTPIYYTVPAGGAGVYRVEFLARAAGTNHTKTILADSAWQQDETSAIYAWDISVINSTGTSFIPGRVYANVLNLSNGNSNTPTTASPDAGSWYGMIYALTKDGYTYRIKNNGNNGIWFSFFVNNNGYINATTKQPLYRSLNNTSNLTTQVQNPTAADTVNQITHKLFYTTPATDLPQGNINGAVPGNSTWLRNIPATPTVTNVSVTGVEGVAGQISTKGGNVSFNTSLQGNYIITIKPPSPAKPRVLTAPALTGDNKVYWDGKDGDNKALSAGNVPLEIIVQLQAAEVHFPYIDMEYNINGTIIERMNRNNITQVEFSGVYWNDANITASTNGSNPDPLNNSHLITGNNGINSNENGHKWGAGATGSSGQFGDGKAIDTWTFARSEAVSINTSVNVRVADLAITSLTANKTQVKSGESVAFTVKVKNNGPDAADGAKFTFTLPDGLTPGSAVFTNTCGSQATAITYDSATRTYTSVLNLPNGCEITYTINAVGVDVPTSANLTAKATVLRPKDVTDPDATNTNFEAPLGTAEEECENSGLTVECNNMKTLALQAVCDVSTRAVNAANNAETVYNLPATDVGYQFDITNLDNSFNLIINETKILARDIQFQTNLTPGINVRFQDGTEYETGTSAIWSMAGTKASPLIRVVINANGTINLFGSKVSNGPLFPLVLKSGSFAPFTINPNAPNKIQITQERYDPTNIAGFIYGIKTAPCICADPANTTGTAADTKVGITLLQRAGADATGNNWPMVRKSGHIALESNTKGFVPTRATTTQINAIPNPQEGMMVFDTDANCLKIHDGTGWKCFSNAGCL